MLAIGALELVPNALELVLNALERALNALELGLAMSPLRSYQGGPGGGPWPGSR